jgi:cobalt/nickel transport system permease protein
MHAHFLDPYRHGRSPVHRLDPRVKLVLAVAYIVTSAALPPGAWPAYVLLFATVFSVILVSELGVSFVYRRAFLSAPFVLAALPLLFTIPGTPLASVSILSWTLTISQEGIVRFGSIALKSWLSVQMAIVLASTTPFPDLLAAMRSLRLPRLLVAVIGLMWRYLFVLVDEVMRLMRAREARSGHPDEPVPGSGRVGGSVVWRAKVTGGMAGNLMLRSFDRSERIYAAMASRGYDGEVRGLPRPPVPPLAWAVLTVGLLFLIMILLLGLVI